jgi:hypothetical protein
MRYQAGSESHGLSVLAKGVTTKVLMIWRVPPPLHAALSGGQRNPQRSAVYAIGGRGGIRIVCACADTTAAQFTSAMVIEVVCGLAPIGCHCRFSVVGAKQRHYLRTWTLSWPKCGNKLTPSVVSFFTQASPIPALQAHEEVTGLLVSQLVSASIA